MTKLFSASEDGPISTTLSVSKEFTKKYGDVIQTADQVLEEMNDLALLPTTPNLDLELGGGVQEGGLTLIAGDKKTGKTTLCLHMCINAVKEGRPVIYVDAESRLKNKQLTGVAGLEECLPLINKLRPPDDQQWAAEDYLTAIEMLVRDPANKGALVIVDSVSSLIPRIELEAELSSQIRDSRGKLLSHWTKKMAQLFIKQRVMVVMIRHFIAETGPSRKTKVADGGRKIEYQADTILNVKYTQAWKEKEEQVGHVVFWDIECSSVGSSARSAESYLRYGQGFDIIQEHIMLADDLGLIKKSGSWFTLTFMEEPEKFQGAGKVRDYLTDNPEVYEDLQTRIREFL